MGEVRAGIVERLRLTPDCDTRAMSDNCVEAADTIEELVEALKLAKQAMHRLEDAGPPTPPHDVALIDAVLAKARGEA